MHVVLNKFSFCPKKNIYIKTVKRKHTHVTRFKHIIHFVRKGQKGKWYLRKGIYILLA